MRIRCFSANENPAVDRAILLVSKSHAAKLLKRGTHRKIDHRTIQAVIIIKPYREPKQYGSKVTVIPAILPPRGPEGLLLTYPLKDYRTCEL